MKRISVGNIASLISSRNQRYLGTSVGGITPGYPAWSFLSSIGSGTPNSTAPGAPQSTTRVSPNTLGDPRAGASGFTNYSATSTGSNALASLLGAQNATINVGGNSYSSGVPNWLMIVVIGGALFVGLSYLLGE